MKQFAVILLALFIAACADAQTPKQQATPHATPQLAAVVAPAALHTRHVTAKDPNRSNRCEATTKKGTRCKRDAKPGSKYCPQHAKSKH